jgi:serine phosphatase RsbU (regulator of sigma subunit)
MIKRSSGASEAEEDGQLPLGMAQDVKYPDCELKLQPGDIVIF